ncbi:hypothetical protein CEUSTIGMA_g13123.t1 [Chlamydomonas eustigma]|uniref:Uncharacterized protein n=1 Tax=Chlamydomonas eustigma TaxID=1157962 RepID=A0A250XRZ2_9CHLO|nr:hypothetical protein CEUSTIGMA_g13123.t1 [Chlamydomonas eustigma]|eukprot:GAX85709.1 hypothetical protein CEUSTIGMA_g13123.t1 [Chlamydomonas eustigma]
MGKLHVYIVDNSDETLYSEDFNPNRWLYQVEALKCLSHQNHSTSSSESGRCNASFSVVGASCRACVLVPPTDDHAMFLSSLCKQRTISGAYQLTSALKLAHMVASKMSDPWLAPPRVVAFIASSEVSVITEEEVQHVADLYFPAHPASSSSECPHQNVVEGLDFVVLGDTPPHPASTTTPLPQTTGMCGSVAGIAGSTSITCFVHAMLLRVVNSLNERCRQKRVGHNQRACDDEDNTIAAAAPAARLLFLTSSPPDLPAIKSCRTDTSTASSPLWQQMEALMEALEVPGQDRLPQQQHHLLTAVQGGTGDDANNACWEEQLGSQKSLLDESEGEEGQGSPIHSTLRKNMAEDDGCDYYLIEQQAQRKKKQLEGLSTEKGVDYCSIMKRGRRQEASTCQQADESSSVAGPDVMPGLKQKSLPSGPGDTAGMSLLLSKHPPVDRSGGPAAGSRHSHRSLASSKLKLLCTATDANPAHEQSNTPSNSRQSTAATHCSWRSLRQGIHATTTTNCRHDSLDSLQHLSFDGFARSWLPSYSNIISKMIPAAGTAASSSNSHKEAAGGSSCLPGGMVVSLTLDQLSFLVQMTTTDAKRSSIHPRWRSLLSVHAGRMVAQLCSDATGPFGTKLAVNNNIINHDDAVSRLTDETGRNNKETSISNGLHIAAEEGARGKSDNRGLNIVACREPGQLQLLLRDNKKMTSSLGHDQHRKRRNALKLCWKERVVVDSSSPYKSLFDEAAAALERQGGLFHGLDSLLSSLIVGLPKRSQHDDSYSSSSSSSSASSTSDEASVPYQTSCSVASRGLLVSKEGRSSETDDAAQRVLASTSTSISSRIASADYDDNGRMTEKQAISDNAQLCITEPRHSITRSGHKSLRLVTAGRQPNDYLHEDPLSSCAAAAAAAAGTCRRKTPQTAIMSSGAGPVTLQAIQELQIPLSPSLSSITAVNDCVLRVSCPTFLNAKMRTVSTSSSSSRLQGMGPSSIMMVVDEEKKTQHFFFWLQQDYRLSSSSISDKRSHNDGGRNDECIKGAHALAHELNLLLRGHANHHTLQSDHQNKAVGALALMANSLPASSVCGHNTIKGSTTTSSSTDITRMLYCSQQGQPSDDSSSSHHHRYHHPAPAVIKDDDDDDDVAATDAAGRLLKTGLTPEDMLVQHLLRSVRAMELLPAEWHTVPAGKIMAGELDSAFGNCNTSSTSSSSSSSSHEPAGYDYGTSSAATGYSTNNKTEEQRRKERIIQAEWRRGLAARRMGKKPQSGCRNGEERQLENNQLSKPVHLLKDDIIIITTDCVNDDGRPSASSSGHHAPVDNNSLLFDLD